MNGEIRPDAPEAAPAALESSSLSPPFLVATVGASAGGLEALSDLVRSIPSDAPLALLLVQHLAHGQPSLLPELLGHQTGLRVLQGRDNLKIQPRHAYVIPPDTHMTVLDGSLRVRENHPTQRRDGTVDAMFRSVAESYGERAVGVVLSGSAHDGAAGIRDIKAAGGITMVQHPDEALIDGMPRAAMATGAVDVVLKTGEIATELVRLSHHPFFCREAAAPTELSVQEGHLRRLFQLMRRSTGVDFSNYKTPTISRRIQRRLALHRLSTLEEYLDYLQRNPGEFEKLHEDLLIHVTSFFRGPDSFEALKERVFPQIINNQKGETPIRVWVPGCSTGEEAYSVAMALLEVIGKRAESVPVHIFGTDVSDRTIDKARAGTYPATIATDVSPERLARFFTPVEGGYRIKKEVRDRCVFARQDVTRDPPFSKLDLIVCRNLLIYLVQATQRKVIGVFHYALKREGYLMLGRSESIGADADLFTASNKKFQIYLKKDGHQRPELEFAPSPPPGDAPASPLPVPTRKLPRRDPGEWDVQGDANRFLLDRYSPAAVIVDSDLRIVRSRGKTSPFLELPAGEATLDLLKMVRPEIVFALRAAVQEARTRSESVVRDGLRVLAGDQERTVNLRVVPLGSADARHFLVTFEDPRQPNVEEEHARAQVRSRKEKEPRGDKGGRAEQDALVERLQRDLAETRQQLQSIIDDFAAANEELQSANEEILSSNEELQSTNEELDTAKEELQSTNEELSTLNDELHGRNEELTRLNSDLVNLLGSIQIPVVMVTTDLRIRRFTPAAEKTLNLIASDLGRPIGHIKPNIICPDLESLIANAIDEVRMHEREVQDNEGHTFSLQIRPYKNHENRIDGAVLALFDITATRDFEAALTAERGASEAILAKTERPVLLLDANAKVRRANPAFCDTFRLSRADVEGNGLYDLADQQWNIRDLRRLLEEVLPRQKSFERHAIEHEFANLGRRKLLFDGRWVESGRPTQPGLIVLMVRDVTDEGTDDRS